MSAIAPLISDLAIILVAAGCSTLVFKGLRQPVILGYIVAGVLAGPSVSFIPTVSDASSIRVWADIGVIFLLFAMGLEFSFRKLLSVGGTAVTAAVTIVAGMMFVGYGTGMSLGFSHMSSIFLGGMLSMSSTAIVFKAFDDMGLRGQRFTGVVLGILVVEDLVGVVLMVLLSTLAVSKQFEGAEMLGSILKLGAFLVFWSLLGIYLIPTLLKRLQRLLNDETLLIVALGLCLGMVMIAVKAGFSAALGAFVMGSLLAETVAAERITRLVEPVKNLFGAIFFVSVGMMIEPALLVRYAGPIVLLTVVVLAGQATFATLGVLVSGQPLRVAVQSGFSLTQVGEFAFIIATLGTTLHVTDDYLYPVIVAVSVVTTFLTPYMMRAADPACDYLERHLPAKWQRSLARYASGAGPESRHNTWLRLLRRMMLPGALYLVFCIFAEAAFLRYAAPWIEARIPGRTGAAVSLAAILAVLAPILLVVLRQGNRSPEFRQLWNDSKFNRGPLVSLILIKCLLCIGILMTVVASLFDTASGMGFAVSLALLTGIVFSKRLRRRSFEMEERLRENFGGDDTADAERPLNEGQLPFEQLHMAEFGVAAESIVAGRTLREIDFRRRYGVTIVAIRRGERRAEIRRETRETQITVRLDLDGRGDFNGQISTGLRFLDHMLAQIAHHGGVALAVDARGDLDIDEHHTMEDVAITLGEAVDRALGAKAGIARYGFALPMDDCRALTLLDFGGRIDFEWDASFRRERVGDVPTEMFRHFFHSFACAARCNLQISARGDNDHHKAEAVFKAFARALRMAVAHIPFDYTVPSSKGVL